MLCLYSGTWCGPGAYSPIMCVHCMIVSDTDHSKTRLQTYSSTGSFVITYWQILYIYRFWHENAELVLPVFLTLFLGRIPPYNGRINAAIWNLPLHLMCDYAGNNHLLIVEKSQGIPPGHHWVSLIMLICHHPIISMCDTLAQSITRGFRWRPFATTPHADGFGVEEILGPLFPVNSRKGARNVSR
jgi:hypothetical protein